MKDVVLKIENVSKQYRLGVVGTGTLSHDLKRWWYLLRGKEDPYLKIGEENNREKEGGDYVWALKDINIEVERGEVVGVIGRNGAGKSTLLKLLSQVTAPTTGFIKVKGRIASLLEVGTGFHPELTGRENIFLNGAILGMTKDEIKSKLDEIIDFSGVAKYIDTPVKRYSSGMMVRLGFAVAAHLEPEILVVDEVLAVGDAEFQKKCLGKMKDVAGEGRTVIFVSHNMSSIRNLCKKGIVMNQGKVIYSGAVEEAISTYLLKNSSDQYENLTIDIQRSNKIVNSGEAEFLQLFMKNEAGEIVNEFAYREQPIVCMKLKVNEKLENVTITLGLLTQYGETFSFAISVDENKIDSFEQGEYDIEYEVPFGLMPGSYGLNLGLVHLYTGASIDYIEYFYPFKVNKETINGKFEYPWATIHGYVEMNNNWKISKIK